jgi:hypothetical protein
VRNVLQQCTQTIISLANNVKVGSFCKRKEKEVVCAAPSVTSVAAKATKPTNALVAPKDISVLSRHQPVATNVTEDSIGIQRLLLPLDVAMTAKLGSTKTLVVAFCAWIVLMGSW